jgi:hypothetical protein
MSAQPAKAAAQSAATLVAANPLSIQDLSLMSSPHQVRFGWWD